ncbi:putative kinesin-like protein [Triangularia verruculosa]|uniref:Kinesin-like protein n=1 Tax=Triangularia verruculosa TaxID=2587418 RepID=A0AAN6XDE2_9PEZI|nr:putative kinesin-like protein [Triangularia verruculosa]
MASSPPASPGTLPARPTSAMVRPAPRSSSRMSMQGKSAGGSRASDEDTKTAVKVVVRVRPPLKPEDPGFELIPQRFQRSMVQVHSPTNLSIESPQGRKLFVFDRVFGPEVGQAGIWEYLDEGVNAFTQGYNVSLLAYGQSGAGKSYTMGTAGDQDSVEQMGVIPRAATALFERLEGPKANPNRSSMSQLRTPARFSNPPVSFSKGAEKNWTLRASYVEIYNEHLRDLLVDDTIPLHERGTVTIREDVKGNILLTGLRQVEVNSVDDLMSVLDQGSTVRQTDATAINARSSRSHAVFSLNLVQKKSKPTTAAERRLSMPVEGLAQSESLVTTDSKMHFVDLAGSERLKNTGAQGERAKEGISINAGLAALGKVISQLSSRQAGAHVSYRDSKLTRLLQDSLGGNAVTYMIACVTPAEFHLSETLNTVQYAQRARAIQSKPRIQQVEEGDKQAIIDRLKAEVAFLREQIRSAERSGGERRTLAPGERPERQSEREVELQNQLLDAQENYTALSQRHAKLIAELARARDEEQSENQLEKNLGDSATERLNRSNSFAQAVEQVVLEYEKTIQSLEQSLASTRATLSNTEGSLLEKESSYAYVETINNQLQARLQKLMDREANTESYLHDLETKLDGHTSGEEKNAAIIMELRKEIARVRENEAACEDYISTLEERLAEADQDAELMQREIDRLEQVVERQRSLGKLDSLLYELDQIQPTTPAPEAEVGTTNGTTNGAGHRRTASRSIADHSRSHSHVSRHSQLEETIPESGEEDIPEEDEVDGPVDEHKPPRKLSPLANDGEVLEYPTSPAQSKFVADKLETMNQELLGLRVEHEATLNEYDLLHAKYEEALRALGQLQDMVDEAKHPNRQRDSMLSVTSPMLTRPTSFLSDARTYETKDTTHLSMRSLSSELSSALESPSATLDVSDAGTAVPKSDSAPVSPVEPTNGADASSEVRHLKAIAMQKEAAEKELAERYAQLEERHHHALDMVEELKTQVARAQAANEDSTKAGHVIRRKSSQTLMIIDRAHRSFASLRNIAAEHFEDQPDVMQNFELNLNAAMHELHARSERIQELETNVATAKKEMETKMTIISGLTRERSSLKAASPMDMAVVSNLRNQLEQSEMRIKELQQANEVREEELETQFAELQELIKQTTVSTNSNVDTNGASEEAAAQLAAREEKISELEKELLSWEERHKSAVQALQDNEEQMKKTISELEAQVATFTAKLSEVKDEKKPEGGNERAVDETPGQTENEDQKLVDFLRTEIDEYKTLIGTNKTAIAEAEKQHQETKELLEQAIKERDEATSEANAQKDLVAKLEAQISDHEQSIKAHQESVHELQSAHQKDVNEIMLAGRRDLESQLAALKSDHVNRTKQLESDLTEAREELMKVATQVAYALGLDVSVERISDRIADLAGGQKALSEEQGRRLELEQDIVELSNINDTVMRDLEAVRASLAEVLAAESERAQAPTGQGFPVKEQVALVRKKVVDLETKNKKNSRLVEELEDQLNKNFDQVQAASNRLSLLQTERHQQLEEANAAKVRLQGELDAIKEEYASLQAKYDGIVSSSNDNDTPQRSNSQQNGHGVRKSSSVASLPSPPPAIPLPPLPPNNSGTTSPTPRPPSKDVGGISQIQEDQEARIRLIEKHLKAEKQLTTTLEEALTDLERQQIAIRADCDAWRRRAQELEQEIKDLKEKPQQDNRWSLQQVEEERRKRRDAEIARAHLEERMNTISKKKKKGSLNCF